MINQDSNIPIYTQIANIIKDQILNHDLKSHDQVYSTNHLAKLFNINPATARKGLSILFDSGIIYKKRGVGMFVCENARDIIIEEKNSKFYDNYIKKIIIEANKIGITKSELITLISKSNWEV